MRLGRTHLIGLLIAAAAVAVATAVLWPPRPVDLTVPAVLQGKDPLLRQRVEQTLQEISADPGNPRLWIRLGYVYEAHLLTSLALDSYLRALDLDENRPRAWYRVAKIKMTMGDRAGALKAARRVVAAAPDFAPIRWRMGMWQLEEGHLEQAQASFEAATALDPDDPSGWWGQARVLLQRQQPEKAAEVLEEVVEKWPRDGYAQLLLGTAYRQLGRWEEARTALELGAGSAPLPPPDEWDREVIRHKTGLDVEIREGALVLRRRAHGCRPSACWRNCGGPTPGDQAVLQNLGMIYSSRKQFGKALEVYRQWSGESPGDVQVHLNMASAYTGLGNSGAALEHLDQAIALDPGFGRSLRKKRAYLLAQMGSYPRRGQGAGNWRCGRTPHNPRHLPAAGAGPVLHGAVGGRARQSSKRPPSSTRPTTRPS